MCMLDYFLSDAVHLNLQWNGNRAVINLSNGKTISVEKDAKHNGEVWDWKIDSQYFSNGDYALRYLKDLIVEKITGKRILLYAKREVPEICGVEGRACRAPGECNRALCWRCPVAEKFFADRDGVELVYAVAD